MFKVKTVLLAALLATSVSVSAQEENAAGSVVVPGLGEVTTGTLVAGAVGVAVVAAIISNSDGDTAPEVKATCNGTDALVNNVCVGSREEVVVKEIVTGTGTATATATTTGTALVSFTYAPTVR
ncbi:MAG: hypothetical protein KKF22_17260 [Gammaproteobacteria bacterium]|jgi:hypothetical protein|nr:hypothetical protein [Gammaproteobacteria bacterium]